MRMTHVLVIVTLLCMGAWTLSAQTQQDQQQAQQKVQQTQEQAQRAQRDMSGQDSMHQDMSGQDKTQHGGMSGQGGTAQQMIAPALIQAPNEMQMQGKVLSHKDVDVQGDKSHRILRVQSQQGQVMMIDLGRKDRLPSGLEVNDGQWVIVTGVQGRLGNDNVLVAHNLANVYNFRGLAPGVESGQKLDDSSQNLGQKVPANEDVTGDQSRGSSKDRTD